MSDLSSPRKPDGAPDDAANDDTPVSPDVSIVDTQSSDAVFTDTQTANALQTASTGRAVARATAGIGVLHFVRLIVGFVQPLIANRLGLLWQAEVYTVSTEIVRSIWIVFEKIVNPTFLPCFARALGEESEERAWKLASTALWLLLLALFVITPPVFWAMPWIVDIYSPNAAREERELTIAISRLLLSGLFFLSVSSLTYVILNGYKRFASAALGDVLWKIGMALAALWAVVQKMPPIPALYVLSWGFVLGAFLKLLPHLIAIGPKWKLLRARIDWRDPLARKMLWLSIPLLIGVFSSELRGLYLFRLADNPAIAVEGSRTALKFSKTIGDNLIQIFPYALSIGIFPYLADMARNRDRQPLTDTLVGALRVCVWVFAPVTAILIAVRHDLLRAVWESGQLTQHDTLVMSLPFIAFTLGLIGFACENLLNQTFYAMTNAWTPTLIGLGTTVLWILLATLGVHYGAAAGWGLAAIAGAEAISKSVKCGVMWKMLRPHLGEVPVRDNLIFALKVLCGSCVAALIAWAVARALAPQGELDSKGDKIKMLLAVTFAGCSGLTIYLALGALLDVREVRALFEFMSKLRKRLAR